MDTLSPTGVNLTMPTPTVREEISGRLGDLGRIRANRDHAAPRGSKQHPRIVFEVKTTESIPCIHFSAVAACPATASCWTSTTRSLFFLWYGINASSKGVLPWPPIPKAY